MYNPKKLFIYAFQVAKSEIDSQWIKALSGRHWSKTVTVMESFYSIKAHSKYIGNFK